MFRSLSTAVFSLGIFWAGLQGARAAESYVVTDLGTVGGGMSLATGINADGKVIGHVYPGPPVIYFAVLFSGTGSNNIPLVADGSVSSDAKAIDSSGRVVGMAHTSIGTSRATRFGETPAANLDLGSLVSEGASEATGINDLGAVVGSSQATGNSVHHAVLFPSDGSAPVDLGTLGGFNSSAAAINAQGKIVGTAQVENDAYHATLFSGTGSGNVDLGGLEGRPEGYATAINASGQIVGVSMSPPGSGIGSSARGTLFSGTGSGNTNLGVLGGDFSQATGINASGQIVGESEVSLSGPIHGFLYNPGEGMIDINTLIDPASGWVVSNCVAINDVGQIAATGTDASGNTRALLLTPASIAPPVVPTPAAGAPSNPALVKVYQKRISTLKQALQSARKIRDAGARKKAVHRISVKLAKAKALLKSAQH